MNTEETTRLMHEHNNNVNRMHQYDMTTCPECMRRSLPGFSLPDPESMDVHALLVELVVNVRELRTALDPILADPSALLKGMGPMGAMFGGMFGLGKS